MIKHVIIWKLKESVENKEETMKSIKSALEGLTGKIEGLEKILVLTDKLPSSSGDLMMDSLFTDDEVASIAYQVGFNNVSYFNRQFKKQYNTTPKEFRKRWTQQ